MGRMKLNFCTRLKSQNGRSLMFSKLLIRLPFSAVADVKSVRGELTYFWAAPFKLPSATSHQTLMQTWWQKLCPILKGVQGFDVTTREDLSWGIMLQRPLPHLQSCSTWRAPIKTLVKHLFSLWIVRPEWILQFGIAWLNAIFGWRHSCGRALSSWKAENDAASLVGLFCRSLIRRANSDGNQRSVPRRGLK